MDHVKLLNLARMIFLTEDTELDCASCDDEMTHLAELVASGEDPETLLPAVYDHIKRCHACREDYEALLAVLKAEDTGLLDDLGQT